MLKRKVYHVVKDRNEGWNVKLEGASRTSRHSKTKQEAIDYGKELAKNASLSQLKIHKLNGKIQTEYSYGRDPKNSKG